MKPLLYGVICCLLLCSVVKVTVVKGDETVQKQAAKQEASPLKETAEKLPAKEERKKQKAQTIGTLLLLLILFLGLVSILFAVFWGRRIRRMLGRNRASTTEPIDEFWYLQPDENETNISDEPPSEE